MGYNFLPCELDQLSLLPPALQDWLPEGDLAWFILDAVAQMNLAAITRTYRADGWGQAAYEPAMMVALLLYAYCLGERSSRRIERLCQRDVAFRVITANQGPDHTTMARFRQTHETELATLFTQVLRLCAEAGLVKVGVVALDGTKIQASAALASNRTAETIAAEVARMLTEAQATDAAEERLSISSLKFLERLSWLFHAAFFVGAECGSACSASMVAMTCAIPAKPFTRLNCCSQ